MTTLWIIVWTLVGLYVVAYILAMTEIIGSWLLTRKFQSIKWNIRLNIIDPAIIPFMAILEAACIYDSAEEFYKTGRPNEHYCRESLLCYLRHGRMSIEEYTNSKRSDHDTIVPLWKNRR